VALLEYNGRNGMMPINEYTTTMRKALHRAMKVGKKEILRVIRVDREKGIGLGMQVTSICRRSR
jgi:translation initiation factor 2 alpha subunit (eIF-2alpha)